MRHFKCMVLGQELSTDLNSTIGSDQFAYRKGLNLTTALIICHHNWLKWLEEDMDFVPSVSHFECVTVRNVFHYA